MRRSTSLITRVIAFTAAMPILILPLLNGPVMAQQAERYRKATTRPMVNELKAGKTDKLTPAQWAKVDAARMKTNADKAAHMPDSRPLTDREMKTLRGRGSYRNKYFAGTMPWHRSLRDANLSNGDLFKSFTDIQVAPAKGAGLAMQRTYNSMDDRIGPFGQGWTHCYDIRIQEENPVTNQTDDSLNYADRTDFFGGRHKYHRDADGLYTPPPYLFDELDSDYDKFLVSGPIKALDDSQHSMDGTTKHFNSYGSAERVCDYIEDRYGNRTNLTYSQVTIGGNVQNLLQTVTDPSSRQIVFTWTNLGSSQSPAYRITTAQGPAYSVAYAYNSDLNLQSVTLDPGDVNQGHVNRATTFGYTSISANNTTETGLLNSVTDALNHTVHYSYVVGFTDPDTGAFTPTYTQTAWVSQIDEPGGVDTNGNTRTNTWTISSGVNAGSGQGTTWQFGTIIKENPSQSDASPGAVVFQDYQLRNTGTYTNYGTLTGGFSAAFDSSNNVIHQAHVGACKDINNGLFQEVSYADMTYGPHGNMLTQTPNGVTSQTSTTTYYDGSQYFQKQSVTDALGHTSTIGVGDKNGADPSNANLPASNGNKGSVLWVRDAGYNVSTSPSYQKQFNYSYNSSGQKVQEVNLNNVVTQYSYGDQWGNLTQVVQDPHVTQGDSHLARTTSMVYDAACRVLQSTDPKNQTSNFNYSSLGQPTSAVFPAAGTAPAETISYTYGANGRTQNVTDNRGTTSLAYENGCDRVSSVTDPVTGAMSYKYGITGERQSMTLSGGGTWNYQYTSTLTATQYSNPYYGDMLGKDDPNSLSRKLMNITDDQGRRVEYTLYSDGRPNQARTNEVFNTQNPPVLVSFQGTAYSYDRVPNQVQTHGWLNTLSNTWNWKDANAVWQQKLLVQNQYSYDLSGQRLSNQIGSLDTNGNTVTRTEAYSYDEINRLKTVDYGDNQTQGYSFDPMGNRLQKQDSASGAENYSFNAANMLLNRAGSSYTNDTNGNTLTGGGRTNTWDSQNRLATCVNGSNTSSFIYATDGIRHQSTVNGTSTDFVLDASMFIRERRSGVNLATYLVGARGPEYRRDDTSGAIRWYLYDGLGSVLGEVDPNGSVTSSRKYDVYGLVRGGNNPSGSSSHKFVGQLGHPSEDSTSLIYMRARYYDPQTGRFISEDPTYHGKNWFVYSNDDPVNNIDANGKITQKQIDWLVSFYMSLGTNLFAAGVVAGSLALALYLREYPGSPRYALTLVEGMTALVAAVSIVVGGLCCALSAYLDGMTPDDWENSLDIIASYMDTIEQSLGGAYNHDWIY